MTLHANLQRAAEPDASDVLEAAIAAAGQRGKPAELTPVLMRYWHELPRRMAEQRRQLLDSIRGRLRAGELTSRALVPFVLGDAEEDIVAAAVLDYLGTQPVSVDRRHAAIGELLDWVRRGLALNRAAVFSTLLGVADPVINDGLGGLRLTLTHPEIEAICRRAAGKPSALTSAFLGDWLHTLDASEQPDAVARAHVAAALSG
jgi:hypothetical protein